MNRWKVGNASAGSPRLRDILLGRALLLSVLFVGVTLRAEVGKKLRAKMFLGLLLFIIMCFPGNVSAHEALPKNITGDDGAPMMLVSTGWFNMGSTKAEELGHDYERPLHRVYLADYYIDQLEVTTSRYSTFLKKTGREYPQYWNDKILVRYGKRPVLGVTWEDAQAYCQYYKKRLPSEAEWDKAARGTDGRRFPWGNKPATDKHANINFDEDKNKDASEEDRFYANVIDVASLPAGTSPYGVHDMEGNVLEWVADWWANKDYGPSPERNPQGPSHGQYKVLRGTAWLDDPSSAGISSRNRGGLKDNGGFHIGFRCAQDVQ